MRDFVSAVLAALLLFPGARAAHAENFEDAAAALGMELPRTPRAAPKFDLERLGSDERIRLEDLGGRVVILHFWATWCAPCREEMIALEDFARALDASKIAVVLVNVDRGSHSTVEDYVAAAGLESPVGLDSSGEVRRAYLVEVFPTTHLIDATGTLRARATGALPWGENGARTLLEQILK